MQNRRFSLLCTWVLLVFLVMVFAACAPKPRKPVGVLDTPEHHVINGNKLLDQGKYQDAKREFDLALSLDPKYATACTGMGVTLAYLGDYDNAYKNIKLGKRYAKTKKDKVWARVGYIRYFTIKADKGFVGDAETHFFIGKAVDKNDPALYYYMGECYFKALSFDKAAAMYTKVLSLSTDYVGQSDERLALVRKIQRAAPGTTIGKQVAILPKITRADVAALFIQELKLDKLYTRFAKPEFDTSFKPPTMKPTTEYMVKAPKVTDVKGHPLSHDIQSVVEIGLRGLEAYPDHTFRPHDTINRAEYALMLEDIFIKVTGDDEVATRYIGMSNRLTPDVSGSAPYFNAVMFSIQRGLLPVMDKMHGAFKPLDDISGADALLAIRRFKEMLKL